MPIRARLGKKNRKIKQLYPKVQLLSVMWLTVLLILQELHYTACADCYACDKHYIETSSEWIENFLLEYALKYRIQQRDTALNEHEHTLLGNCYETAAKSDDDSEQPVEESTLEKACWDRNTEEWTGNERQEDRDDEKYSTAKNNVLWDTEWLGSNLKPLLLPPLGWPKPPWFPGCCGCWAFSCAPHDAQNGLPSGFCAPHFGQNIILPLFNYLTKYKY